MNKKVNKIINKIYNMIKNNKLYICSFLIGVLIISVLYKLNNTTPFGDRSLLCIDFYHQYGPMLGELYDKLHGSGNFIYSFSMGLGLPFFRNFLNYLSSPFNIIMIFFKRSNLLTSYSIIIGLKAVMSCVFMVYYLSKKFNTKELYLIPLGIIYAFSAYFSAYYWNIMWLDGMVFLPIITYGIERLVNNNTWKLYSISLGIMLIANYFIGYMICIYSVVYFLIYNLYKFKIKKKETKKNLIKLFKNCLLFGVASIIGGMLSFALLLPLASSMESISATGGTMPTTQYYAFEFIDYIKGHLTGVSTTVFASDEITNPNISCGILSVALLLAYLLNLEIPIKNKICYFLILGFFIAAFFIPQLDYIMHAFHVPNDLPYRYSFLYSYVLVVICAYSLINIKKLKFPLLAIGYVFLMVLLLYISEDNWAGMTKNMIYINMILLTLYFIFYSGIYFTKDMHKIFYCALIAVASIDVIVSINYNWDITQDMNGFYADYEATEELLNYIEEIDNEEFYRIENTTMMTLNDPSWYNYYGMTTFSSMAYEAMATLQHNLGLPGNQINSYYYAQTTPIYDLMFDIKYFIGESNDYNRYTVVKTIDETANEFTYNVGLAFGVSENIQDWNYISSNPFEVQNDFIEKSTGIEEILEEAQIYKSEEIHNDGLETVIKYTIENTYDNFYFYTTNYTVDFFAIGTSLYYVNTSYEDYIGEISEITYTYLESYNEEKVININSGDQYIEIYVGYTNYYTQGFNLYTINQGKLVNCYNYLINYKLDITSFKENKIEGNIYLGKDMDIYTSIPYDEGWQVYIDGVKAETFKIGDALLGVKGVRGSHEIKFVYKIPHLGIGLLCTISAILVIILDTLRVKGKIKLPKIKSKKIKHKKTRI